MDTVGLWCNETETASAVQFAASRRTEIPLLNNSDVVYLDSASSQQKPQAVLRAMEDFAVSAYANVHRGVYSLSQAATARHDQAREKVASFISSPAIEQIIFTKGTTDALNLVAASFGRSFLQPGDEIVLTILEHHSNIVPWQLIAEEKGAVIRWAKLEADGSLSVDSIRAELTPKTKIVSFSAHSNVLGLRNPVAKICEIIHTQDAIAVVDAAQAICHEKVDVTTWNADFIAFSGHKLYGPTGIGVLFGRRELLERMPPYQGGGDMIRRVTTSGTTFNDLPYKFEAGTPAIIEAIGLAAAIGYIESIGHVQIEQHERCIMSYLEKSLAQIPGVRILGPVGQHVGLVSFTVDDIHPHDMAQFFDSRGLCLRAGHHCAQPLMDYLGVQSTLRASISAYTSPDEVDRLATAIVDAKSFFLTR